LSTHNNNSNISGVNYPILAVNAGIIGSVFIFFAIAAQVPASTIFALDTKKCSFGFNLLAQHAQIGVVMVGGIIIILFSISSVLALIHRSIEAALATSMGFGVMFVAAIIIVSSLACRLPTDFFIDMMVVPFIVIIIVIVGVHMYSERKEIKDKT
jgi:ABC-type multidrug transport system fused ATPase/permease subunit